MRGGWERDGDEAGARRLPSVEDLPRSGDGYDRDAVEAAFESFYRHAAEVDRTLEVLEAVAAFQREAGSLRADIRSLRAAAWGPVPTLRHTVATTAAARVDRGGAAFGAWPRIALYSAFIILVAVGAALADLSSGALVLIVLAAWVVVGLAEFAVSGVSGRAAPVPHGYPAWAVEPAAEDEDEAIAEVEELEELEEPEPVVEAAAEDEVEAIEPVAEEQPEERPAWRPWRRTEPEVAELEEPPSHVRVLPVEDAAAEAQALEEPEPVVEAAAQGAAAEELAHDEPEPEVEALPEPEPAEPEAEAPPEEEPALAAVADEPEAEAELEPEGEAELEPEAEAELEPEAEPVAEAEPAPEPYETPLPPARQPRLRFWRRRPEPQPPPVAEPEPSEPRHVRIIEVEPASPDETDIPWEGEQPAAEAEQLDAWERAEVPPEPLFAPEPAPHEPEPAAQPPVRDSGPGEGARGNREVPPTTDEALESAADEPEPEPEPTATADDGRTEEPSEHAERRAVFMRRGRR